MPYITKKQLKSLGTALTMADCVINNNVVIMYGGTPIKWRDVSYKAFATTLELYQKQRQINKKYKRVRR